VAQFGTRLVVVMGHTRCGAVAATVNAISTGLGPESKNIRAITDRIAPHLQGIGQPKGRAALLREAVRANVRASVDHLRHGSQLIEELVLAGRVAVVGAEYQLETGAVRILDGIPTPSRAPGGGERSPSNAVRTKRIYEAVTPEDGFRVLVDRLWPRGISKERAHVDVWARELAPSDALRKWYGHRPARWEEFQRRFARELEGQEESFQRLLAEAQRQPVTLLYASRETELNNAAALKGRLEERLRSTAHP